MSRVDHAGRVLGARAWLVALQLARPAGSCVGHPTVQRSRTVYLSLLTWAFTLFNTLRAVAYLPTMWAIQASGDW